MRDDFLPKQGEKQSRSGTMQKRIKQKKDFDGILKNP